MINTMKHLTQAWYNLIGAYVSVPVYKEDVPEDEAGNYVQIRAEGGSDLNNKHSFNDAAVIVIDIVTVFQNNINRETVETIDTAINSLLLLTPRTNALISPTVNLQILNVARSDYTYIEERDDKRRYYRKVSRYSHRIHQIN